MAHVICLMYHELEAAGRPVSNTSAGYMRYVVPLGSFRDQLEAIVSRGLRGCALSDATRLDARPCVTITFDDGCETDLTLAAPELAARGFGATFYVTSAFLDRPGYLATPQLRELSSGGFEIGCHGATHRFLPDLPAAELAAEIVESRDRLEQIIGRPVVHLSCPGGRWSTDIAQAAEAAGYRTVATSRVGANDAGSNPYSLARNAIYRTTSLSAFDRLIAGRGLRRQRLQQMALDGAKRALGNGWYVKLRELSLGSGAQR